LSLLDEPNDQLISFSLKKLVSPYEGGLNPGDTLAGAGSVGGMSLLDVFWHEIANKDTLVRIEELSEDKAFPDHELASLVCSKVYYHLGAFDVALRFALGAGKLFDVNQRSEYVETIIAKCIDSYTQKKVSGEASEEIDPRQEAIVNQMFDRCFRDGQFRQAMGIAIETHRMDIFVDSIKKSREGRDSMLSYAFRVVMTLIPSRSYRNELLKQLINLYRESDAQTPDFVQMVQCLIFLDDTDTVAGILETLSQGTKDDILMAYQIAFDLYESATQQFLNNILQAIKRTAPIPAAIEGKPLPATSSTEASGEAMEVEGEGGEASDDAKPEAEKNPEKSAVQEPKIEDLSAQAQASAAQPRTKAVLLWR